MKKEDQQAKTSSTKPVTATEWMNGDILVRDWCKKQYGLGILIGVYIFLYIFFGFQTQRQQHELDELKKELQTKHFEQLTVEAELTERTRQSAISRKLSETGSELKENNKPVIHIP